MNLRCLACQTADLREQQGVGRPDERLRARLRLSKDEPDVGAPVYQDKVGRMKRSLIPLICVLGALALTVSACGAESDTQSGDTSQAVLPAAGDGANDSPSKNDPTFKGGVLTTPDVKIKITRHRVIKPGQKGNEYGEKPLIAFWYTMTNLSGAEVEPVEFVTDFAAYQDNNPDAENKLNVGPLPDERFLDSQTENIKKGGTVENAASYELDDLTTPVELVATTGLDGSIGKITYGLK